MVQVVQAVSVPVFSYWSRVPCHEAQAKNKKDWNEGDVTTPSWGLLNQLDVAAKS